MELGGHGALERQKVGEVEVEREREREQFSRSREDLTGT